MQITCANCEKKFRLPPEKVPSQRFSFTCPKCGNRIKVDPVQTEALKIEELRPPVSKDPDSVEITLGRAEADQGHPQPTPEPESPGGQFGDDTLPAGVAVAPTTPSASAPDSGNLLGSLRPIDRQLLSGVAPAAYVVHLEVEPTRHFDNTLRQLGLSDVQHFQSLEEATTALEDSEAGILMIRMHRCPAPPCEPLAPLHALSFAARRRTFVVLEAENVKTLNGQVAFFLQVNCLINRQDSNRLGELVLRALLFRLRLYQHWDLEAD